jgi:hypothetical protein
MNNKNLIINERNNLNIYYNASKLINNNILNYNSNSSSSENYLNNLINVNQISVKNKFLQNKNKMKEIIKKVNQNILCNNNKKKIIHIKKNNNRQMPQKKIEYSGYNNYMNDTIKMVRPNSNNNNNNYIMNMKNIKKGDLNNYNKRKNNLMSKINNKPQFRRSNSQMNENNINKANYLFNNEFIDRTDKNLIFNKNRIIIEHRYYSPQQNLINYRNNSAINKINFNINNYNNIENNNYVKNTEETEDYYINYL